MFAKTQRVHLIGIGGIGMSGIAEILLNLGYSVSGSDIRPSPVTERLAALGATIFEGHAAANVVGSGVVVASTAVASTPSDSRNPEVAEARRRKIPVIQRAEMLAELMRLKYGVAVAGMHGKTTTTSMIASVLSAGGLDPTVVVGGRVDALGSNARLGSSRYLVAEADESDRSFLKLSPIHAVVTNLDREHMDTYRDMEDVENAFVAFMDRVPFYGSVIACCDNAQLSALLPRVQRRVFSYGFSAQADYVVRQLTTGGVQPHEAQESLPVRSRFEVVAAGQVLGPFALRVPGEHNVLNAAAAVAIAHQLDVANENIITGLLQFRGVERRFQNKGCVGEVAVIDDYGHHPTELRATLCAARACNYRRIHVIFQPHRYTRTRDLHDEFVAVLREADSAQVLDVYPASEAPIPGVTAEALVQAAAGQGAPVMYAPGFAEAAAAVARLARPGDAILTMGAGSVAQAAPLVLDSLRAAQHRD